MTPDFLTILLCFFVSFLLTYININLVHKNLARFIKLPTGPQTIHKGNIPRLGGISIILSFIIMSTTYINEDQNLFFLYFLISLPVFIFGIIEDFTQSISPKIRLIGSILTAVMFVLVFEKLITKIGIWPIDQLLKYNSISIFITLLSITYLTQAFNIIDGLNGLSLMTAIISLLSISIIFYEFGDFEIGNFSLYLICILSGVLVFNFPSGRIFIGDSGAYIVGLFVAALSITLADKNISPFVIAQILIFPAYELLRSTIRRMIKNKASVLKPDKMHLHSILHTFNTKKFSLSDITANILSSSQLIFFQLINFFYLVSFYNNEKMVVLGIVIFILTYEIVYITIITKLKKF